MILIVFAKKNVYDPLTVKQMTSDANRLQRECLRVFGSN